MPPETKQKKHRDFSKHWKFRYETAFFIVIAVFFLMYGFAIRNFIWEDIKDIRPHIISGRETRDHMEVEAKAFWFDPINEKMEIKFDIEPKGKYNYKYGMLSEDLTMEVSNIDGNVEYQLKKNKILNVFTVVIPMYGRSTEYPFDKYQGWFAMRLLDKSQNRVVSVPINFEFTENLQGFDVKVDQYPGTADWGTVMHIDASRSKTVQAIAIAGILLMWAMGIAVIWMTVAFTVKGQKIESLAFYSALLFALVGFRNSLPDTPPIGTISDYLGFFWVMGIVSIMMIIKIVVLLRRPE